MVMRINHRRGQLSLSVRVEHQHQIRLRPMAAVGCCRAMQLIFEGVGGGRVVVPSRGKGGELWVREGASEGRSNNC